MQTGFLRRCRLILPAVFYIRIFSHKRFTPQCITIYDLHRLRVRYHINFLLNLKPVPVKFILAPFTPIIISKILWPENKCVFRLTLRYFFFRFCPVEISQFQIIRYNFRLFQFVSFCEKSGRNVGQFSFFPSNGKNNVAHNISAFTIISLHLSVIIIFLIRWLIAHRAFCIIYGRNIGRIHPRKRSIVILHSSRWNIT